VAVTRLHCANTAEQIEVLLGMETPGDFKNTCPKFPHGFDVAFAKLLWALVCILTAMKSN